MDDDINTAQTLARLFDLSSEINSLYQVKMETNWSLKELTLKRLQSFMPMFVNDILGLKDEGSDGADSKMDGVMQLLIDIRKMLERIKIWLHLIKLEML